MMLARICRRAAVWLLVLVAPAVAAAVPAASAGGSAALPWSFLSVLGLGGLAAVAGGYLWFGDAGQRRRDRLHRRWLDRLALPAAISTVDGTIVRANRAARPAGAARCRSVLDLFAGLAEIDAGAIYRIASAARRQGFAAERVSCPGREGDRILTARLDAPDKLVWALAPPDSVVLAAPGVEADRFRDAPFCHLTIGESGAATGNAMFEAVFGTPPDPEIPCAAEASGPGGATVLLKNREGRDHCCRVFSPPPLPGSPGGREVFILTPAPNAPERIGSAAALEAVPVALVQLDLDGRILWLNGLAGEMIGHGIEPGTALQDLVISLGRPVAALLAESAGDSRGRREMLRLRGEDDSFLQISVTHVTLDGAPTAIAVLSDASELRQLEDKFVQSQKMEAVGKLAGGVAHDFNNVLTAISGHSDLLLIGKDALHPDYSDLIQIRQNTHRAAALVRQLLAFSRKQTLNPALLSVQDVVSDTQYLLNRLIGERVTLSLDHGRDLGPVRADRQQLEQALMNLVVNARDAMPNGGTVTIATSNRSFADNSQQPGFEIPAGEYVEISVSDEGTGIEAHALDRVFDPFFTTKPQGEGTGLGLSTVYGIVKQSGGYVFAENRSTGGACFRILLPRAYPGAADVPAVREPAPAEQRDLTGKGAILLVEDEYPVRAFASRALRLRGYEVIEAASAEEAMVLIDDAANRIDLLVSDVVMPGTDGPTLAVHARQKRPGLRVVFISGYAEDSFRRNLVDRDFMFLPKPFSLVDLTAKVKEALGAPAGPSEH